MVINSVMNSSSVSYKDRKAKKICESEVQSAMP